MKKVKLSEIKPAEIIDRCLTLFGDSPEDRRKAKYVLIGGLSVIILILFWLAPSKPEQETMAAGMKMAPGMPMHMRTFGPGDGYHVHKQIDPTRFKHVKDISKKAADLPPPIKRNAPKVVTINLKATEVISDIVPMTGFHYWTYNNTVPGPFLRVRIGDTVELTLENDKSSSHDHSIDLHAVSGPGGGAGLTEVKPGEKRSFRFKTLNPGLYVYHCATPNAPTHIANGMYGLILVEPEGGLPQVDKEFYIMQGELYTKGMLGQMGFQAFDGQKMIEERPEYIVFNGRPWSIVEEGALKVKVGDRIRLFVGNGGVSKVSSFHVIGEIFDHVYPEAAVSSPLDPLEHIQTTLIPAAGALIAEFRVDVPGDYVMVDHALTRIDRGAWGLLSVSGKEQPGIFTAIEPDSRDVDLAKQ
jgi:nitrite reductase (NO-forming)